MTTNAPFSLPFRTGAAMLLSALFIVFSAAVAVGQVTRASALTNCTVADNTVDAEERAFVTLINQYRIQNGKAPLTVSLNLSRATTWHGKDMGTNGYFSHTDSLGRSPSTRAVDCGYPAGAGENIAAGTVWDTAQEAFTAWRNSSGHNANMLNGSYTQIGVARVYVAGSPYTYYWVTDFGVVNDGTSTYTGLTTSTTAATTTPTPTPAPATTTAKAALSSPVPGSTLPGSTATFQWTTGSGAQEYFFYAGTTQGSNNIIGKSMGLTRSLTVTNLPTGGQTVYVRLWTRFASGWQYTDYTYKAAVR